MHSARSINKILKVCIIGLQRYRDYKFLACGTDSIHLTKEMSFATSSNFLIPIFLQPDDGNL